MIPVLLTLLARSALAAPLCTEAEACHDLGERLQQGLGLPGNYVLAASAYQRGCELGSARACGQLANAYENGRGVHRNDDQGHALHIQAWQVALDGCEQDQADDCEYLARHALDPDASGPLATDLVSHTVAYARKACEGGSLTGCELQWSLVFNDWWRVMMQYRVAEKVGLEGGRAHRALAEQRCTAGDAAGCEQLARGQIFGIGGDKELDAADQARRQALDLHVPACARGDALSCRRQRDLARSLGLEESHLAGARRSCEFGDPDGCRDWGELEPAQLGAARLRACELGSIWDCGELRRAAEEGVARQEADRRYLAAANAQCEQDWERTSCDGLALAHISGIGLPRMGPGATSVIVRACELGSGRGCARAAEHAPLETLARVQKLSESCRAEPTADACYGLALMCEAQLVPACEALDALDQAGVEGRWRR